MENLTQRVVKSFDFDVERSRITINGTEVAMHSDQYAVRTIKGIEDVMGYERAAQVLQGSAARSMIRLILKEFSARQYMAEMSVEEKLFRVVNAWKILGYGALEIEELTDHSARISTANSYLAVGYLENQAAWHLPRREQPFCHDMAGYLLGAFSLLMQKPPESVRVRETHCRTTGDEKCVFELEVTGS
ncbi:MAG: hypothetical protein JW750_04220 [Anaerolineaceae bacterium]|nr:hypothetical protein [Anaerolineaceae bacterium]